MSLKEDKIKEFLKHSAAEFLGKESNKTSLLTVTNIVLAERGKQATIYFTVFPQNMEAGALDFAKRKRGEFREYLKSHSRMQRLPFVEFAIDLGEKNRQRVDELLKN